jgi:MAE_28990/MAE_18760-like HEPN
MSKINRTLDLLISNLDDDYIWRIKELSILKGKIPKMKNGSLRNDEQDVLIRAGITLLYAHWEGFIKFAADGYLNYVSLRRLKHSELQSCFVAICLKKKISELETNKFELQQVAVNFLLDELENRAAVPYEGVIQTKSNLRFHVFRDICILIGIAHDKYQLKQKAIDSLLCDRRNTIAHGKYLIVDYDGYLEIYNIITEIMREIKDDIVDAATHQKYKRVMRPSIA